MPRLARERDKQELDGAVGVTAAGTRGVEGEDGAAGQGRDLLNWVARADAEEPTEST